MSILEKHSVEKLSQGGFVLVLNNEAKIDSQAEAMLQALHSRSTGGIKHHLEVLKKEEQKISWSNFTWVMDISRLEIAEV